MTDFPEDAAGPREDAAAWFAKLQSDAAQESDWAAFEVWLTAAPANQASFDAAERLWIDLDLAPAASAPTTAVVLPFARRPTRLRWGVWAAAGGIAAAVVIGVFAPHLLRPVQAEPMQTLVTAKGERKTLTFAGGDGAGGDKIEIGADSRLSYRFGGRDRRAALLQGEAIFSVAHDPRRPFAVVTGDRRITDVGTVFDVARLDHAVRVTVQQGEVAVGGADAGAGGATTVPAGLQLTHVDGAAGSNVRAVDTNAALAWRSGRLVYSDASLDAVVADLNRYFPTPIRVKDRKTAGLRFSGVLVLDSEGAVVDRLQAFMPVAAVPSNGVIWIGARR
jgi:transmembrane sensor